MRSEDFHYELPAASIAQHPVSPRDAARLLVVSRSAPEDEPRHLTVRDLPELLDPHDLLVVNDTRVLPARLVGRRPGGGRCEALILERHGGDCIGRLRPGRKARPGEAWLMEDGALVLTPREALGDGRFRFRLEAGAETDAGAASADDLARVLERHGRAPLPPYIDRREDDDPGRDRSDYQTAFARRPGAVAAPTAGLHFTDRLLARLDERGVERVCVTLHVGEGTFAPVRAERLEDHEMHTEWFEVSEDAARAVARTRARGGRVCAVGTTSVRALESRAEEATDGRRPGVVAGSGTTRLFLHPSNPPRVVDVLMTNFHLPGSTLIALVAAFLGRERTLAVYETAVRHGYRFFSYGDAMLILP